MSSRDYKKEYREYHSRPDQKKNRAKRNKANRNSNCGPGQEVDHKVPLSKGGGNTPSNWRVVSRKSNRKKYDKTAASDDYRKRVALWLHDGRGNILAQDDTHRGLGLKMPGGGIDKGQSINTAARREALEEVGFTISGSPRAIPGIRPKKIKWDPVFSAEASSRGRDFTGSKHYHRLAKAGLVDKSLLGSEGDSLRASWIPIQRVVDITRQAANDPNNKYNYFDAERLPVAEKVRDLLLKKSSLIVGRERIFKYANSSIHSRSRGMSTLTDQIRGAIQYNRLVKRAYYLEALKREKLSSAPNVDAAITARVPAPSQNPSIGRAKRLMAKATKAVAKNTVGGKNWSVGKIKPISYRDNAGRAQGAMPGARPLPTMYGATFTF